MSSTATARAAAPQDRSHLDAAGLARRFRGDHAPLLADVRRATESPDVQFSSRAVELTRILRVVARAYIAEASGEPPGEEQLEAFLDSVRG